MKKILAVIAVLFLASCSGVPSMSQQEKMVLGCDASAQAIDIINDIIASDIVKVNAGQSPALSMGQIDTFETSKNIIVSFCTAPVLDVANGLTAIMVEYITIKLLQSGVK